MKNYREFIELWFATLAHWIYANRYKTLVMVLLFFAALVSKLPEITIDTSTEGFLHEKDPVLLRYNDFRDQFGRDEIIVVAVETADVFDQEFLAKLKKLHAELEEKVPHLDDITSLLNARNTRGQGDELIVEDLLEKWPQDEAEMETLRARVMNNPLYVDLLISEDATFTVIAIKTDTYSAEGAQDDLLAGFDESVTGERKFLTDHENSETVEAVRNIVAGYDAPDFRIHLTGTNVITHFLKQSMMKDMRRFVGLAVLIVGLCLFVMFRRFSGVVLPLLIVIMTLLSTLGFMAWCGAAIKVPTQILPSFLLAVCVGAAVHLLAMFYHHERKNGSKEDAIVFALSHSGLAVVMTSVTTASGLISFAAAEVAPIADLGVYGGMGVLISLMYTIILLPALLAILPVRSTHASHGEKITWTDRAMDAISAFACGHARSILLVSAVLVAVALVGITRINFGHDVLRWFPRENYIRQATELINKELKGSVAVEVVVDTGRENGLYEPEMLNRIEQAEEYFKTISYNGIFVGHVTSLTTILKESNRALHANDDAYYSIPQSRPLVAQELLLFENSGSDDLEDFVDSQFSKARVTAKLPFEDAIKYNRLMDEVEAYLAQYFPDIKAEITGMGYVLFRTVYAAIHSMARSYVTAVVVITLLMIFLIGRVRIGLLSMIPNLAPIIVTMGFMGFAGIPMDLFTMLVGSIALGLAVDDTIHFMHNFRRYYEHSGDPALAVRETLHTSGRAMLVTSIVLCVGFAIFGLSTMNNITRFGGLTAMAIALALAADYLIAPALMVLVNKKKEGDQ